MGNIVLLFCYVCLTVTGMAFIKAGGRQELLISSAKVIWQVNPLTLIGLACYAVSFVLYIVILPKYNLSYIFPILSGVVFVLTVLASYFVFKEAIGLYQWIGIAAILFGAAMMNLRR